MRLSVLSALCIGPLALATTLEANLHARGALRGESVLVARNGQSDSSKADESKGSAKDKNNDGASSTQPIIIEQSSSTEVILIWYNQGGNADTTTVTQTKTVTAAANGVAAAAATHNVSTIALFRFAD